MYVFEFLKVSPIVEPTLQIYGDEEIQSKFLRENFRARFLLRIMHAETGEKSRRGSYVRKAGVPRCGGACEKFLKFQKLLKVMKEVRPHVGRQVGVYVCEGVGCHTCTYHEAEVSRCSNTSTQAI
jgi:hypothetical protein